MTRPRAPSEALQRYALGLARERLLAPAAKDSGQRRAALLRKLRAAGIKGWPKRMTLFTKQLPMGCRPCLQGQGSNLVMTLKCNRDCFFCFNPKPRAAGMSVHGRSVRSLKEGVELLASLGVKSVGISGGEPLLEKKKVLALARALRKRFGRSLRIDLYTNGDLLSAPVLKQLKSAGVSGLRVNLAANGYDPAPVGMALEVFKDVEVEIPMIPEDKGRVLVLLGQLEELGCRHLILHELFASAANVSRLSGRRAHARRSGLTWSGVEASEEAALEVLLAAAKAKRSISVYYCSTGTQGWISRRAMARAARG
ncbi:MAG: radical SAM protein [Elusimicrobia bacterium]|nr:radical SAM protein [Elusimicrobiota bacterium]